MAQETFIVDPNEDLETLMGRLKQSRSKDVLIVLPNKTRALETLDNFNALRRMVREESINLSFTGGSKTVQGLAKLLGFQIDKNDGTGGNPAMATDPSVPPSLADFATTPTASGFGGGGAFGGNGGGASPFEGGIFGSGGSGNAPSAPFGGGGGGGGFGLPDGFVVQNNDAPPARPTNAQDLFNQMGNFEPPIPRGGPPPSPFGNGGAFGGGNEDMPLTRDNVNNFFDDVGGAPGGGFFGGASATPPPPPPRSPFDTGTTQRTMTLEEAQRQGFLDGENNTTASPFGGGSMPNGNSLFNFDERDDDDDIPSVLPGTGGAGDNAADNFRRRGGVRRDNSRAATMNDDEMMALQEAELGKPSRRRPKAAKAPKERAAKAAAGTGAVAGLGMFGTRIRKLLNPVDPAPEGSIKMASTITPEQREVRKKQGSSLMFGALLGLLLLIFAVGIILFLFSLGNTSGQPTTVAGGGQSTVTIGLGTGTVSNTVTILLEPSTAPLTASTAVPGVAGTSSTAATGTAPANAAGGRLVVQEVSTGDITKKLDTPYPAFGAKKISDGTAKGTATITNGSLNAIGYGAGQTIYKNQQTGIEYKTVTAITVPAANLYGAAVGRATVQVQASVPGSGGNQKAVSTSLGASAALSLSDMAGGSEREAKVVSPSDQEFVKNDLIKKAQDEANNQLKSKYDATTQGIFFAPSKEPGCTFSKQVGEEANDFIGSCTVSLKAFVYNKSALTDAVKGQLLKDSSQSIAPDSVKLGQGQLKQEQGNRYSYTVPANGIRYTPMTEAGLNDIPTMLAGKTLDQVKDEIKLKYPGIFIITTGVTGTFPTDASKIKVEQKYDFEVKEATAPAPSGTGTPAPSGTVVVVSTSTPGGR